MHRVNKLVHQLAAAPPAEVLLEQSFTSAGSRDDDVVIVAALRTPIGKAGRGDFAKSYIEELLAPVLKAILDATKLDPASIGDIVVGNVLGQGVQRANEARIAAFMAGIPDSVPVHTVNRQCSSGLQALAHVAANIKAGYYDIGIGAGMEAMSKAKFGGNWEGAVNPKVFLNKDAKDCLLPMGITSENVAKLGGITRQQQDTLAVSSHAKAAKAIASGRFKDEIVPVPVEVVDKKTGRKVEKLIDTDGGVRASTTMQSLAKLRPAFDPKGTTTAGSSSQLSDGAAAVLAMKRSKARELGLPVLGVFKSFAVAGCAPAVMGIGPYAAIPPALEKAGLKKDDIDIWEINEAFASQAVYCVEKLGINWDKVNPNGGAIALGHPLGCTGARMTATLLHEMKKQGSKYGVVSMCIGSGMGAAAVFERD